MLNCEIRLSADASLGSESDDMSALYCRFFSFADSPFLMKQWQNTCPFIVAVRTEQSIDFFIFILLSRESHGGAVHMTNQDSLRSCACFQVFRLNIASDFFSLLFVRFHQAKIIVVKHLIHGRNNEAWVGVGPSTVQSWPS